MIMSPTDWTALVTAGEVQAVTAPTHPGPASQNNSNYAAIHTYLADLRIYEQHGQVEKAVKKALQAAFPNSDSFLDLEDENGFIKDTPYDMYKHAWDDYVHQRDKDQELTKAERGLAVEYNPSESVTIYFKKMQLTRTTMKELGKAPTDVLLSDL